jgi:predicted nucleic acid-binding protein
VKVVCDTNVLIAGMVAEGLCRDIVKRRLLGLELITSRALLDELARTLRRKFSTDPAKCPC